MPPAKPTAAAARMSDTEIARVQAYLRKTLGNPKIMIEAPAKPGQSAEVTLDGEFFGTLNRDIDEGEVSYALHVVILEEDLPEPPALPRR
ncbi:DUF3126 family protein [Azospirillum agricola]|uniref:DUF3126 family protein n=1 Tax=Azospirillum agricola TaxID=1720247 RepID=UPI000A0EFD85|nr:DUF3126 family protein [Azospirillum agricola]MBP2228095.1 hypothetical protein [Azospirillum agricola]SMH54085.1 Protein of unknown function [Azospirillum lipoferum]